MRFAIHSSETSLVFGSLTFLQTLINVLFQIAESEIRRRQDTAWVALRLRRSIMLSSSLPGSAQHFIITGQLPLS